MVFSVDFYFPCCDPPAKPDNSVVTGTCHIPIFPYQIYQYIIGALAFFLYFKVRDFFHKYSQKNPAYGRHQLSRPMRIEGPVQIWRGCVIYLFFSSFFFFFSFDKLRDFFLLFFPSLPAAVAATKGLLGKKKKIKKN